MTTTHNPAAMIAASIPQAPTIPAGYAALGVVTVCAILALYVAHRTRLVTKLLRSEEASRDAQLAANEAKRQQGRVKASAVLAAAEDRIANNVASSATAAAAVIAKAKSIDGMDVHYVESPAGWAPTMPAAFDAKRGAL